MSEQNLREQLADLCHRQWSGWMKYLFGKSVRSEHTNIVCIPPDLVERWGRQVATDYANLSEAEQNSDRKEADKFLALIEPALAQAKREVEGWKTLARNMEEAVDNVRAALGLESTHWMVIHNDVTDALAQARQEATEAERKRCREEECKPLKTAGGNALALLDHIGSQEDCFCDESVGFICEKHEALCREAEIRRALAAVEKIQEELP